MKVDGQEYRTIWMEGTTVFMIEQNLLPFEFKIHESSSYFETCFAITTMTVRGAGALGAAAGFAMAQAFMHAPVNGYWDFIVQAREEIEDTRPTARNLFYAVDRVFKAGKNSAENAVKEAQLIAEEDARDSRMIGKFGAELFGDETRVLTHCNAGWLAFVNYGTALSPIYYANKEGKKIFVYVDETRPRNQGAKLTAWELKNEKIEHVIIPDNAAAHFMSQKKVDMVIVGADRIASNGDVANKIGTLEKAIIAKEYDIPFYVAAPTSTFDLECKSGQNIKIENRSEEEVLFQTGMDANGNVSRIRVAAMGSPAENPAFDVTPAKYITGIITEKGIIKPCVQSIKKVCKS
ncbi:MAG: S-methyl-5-thioribose-1-phosphate isomerase [Bacteroidetes bacterium]|nr:S-methyl-5-thioribose-1-phosphate isomerase [Bacteroidota bacterium]